MRKLSFLFVMVFISVAVMAQVTTSSINGIVTDEQGQPLVGATLKAIHLPTGTVYAISTLKTGKYTLNGMRVGGPYEVECSYIGCNSETITDIYLTVGEEATFNFKLKESIQTMDEIVVVGRTNPVFNSNRTGAQEVITKEIMSKLPTMNRSLDDFTKLTPMSSRGSFGGTSYRFNNITVDGASFNNSFGLSSSLGASGVEPISLEAIEQVQVMIAPYDVRNGSFTGAGINSVTKSGTNDWQAAAYFYKKSPSLTGWRQKDDEPKINEFKYNQYGVSLSGPIIKNKLFFFINGELDRQETPINYRARKSSSDPITGNYSKADEETLNSIRKFLVDNFNYNPGTYNVTNIPTEADRITARIDWNINRKNTMSVKYFYLRSYNTDSPSSSGAPAGGRGPNSESIPFSSCYSRSHNNFNIVMFDLNTTINERMSNTLKVGYSALRDYCEMDGGFFPQVDILDGSGRSFTTFGTEANSYNNMLNSDIYQIQDNFLLTLGKHQLTIGTQSDYRHFKNGYANSFAGQWSYASVDDFYADVNAYLSWKQNGSIPSQRPTTNASYFKQVYIKDGSTDFPYAIVDVLSLGFYVQDKWTVIPNLKLTLGLRLDTPIFLNELERNPEVEALTFQGGQKIDVSKYPKTKPLFSPRLGFNWDVFDNRTFQVRGGTGIFSGTPPYVWLSNQAGNNGLLFGLLSKGRPFDGVAIYQPTAADIQNSKMDLAVTDRNFKYPQLWKTDIAADFMFGDGWILTGELLYNKDIHAIYHTNIGLNEPTGYVMEGGKEGRPFFATGVNSKGRPTGYFITDKTENVVMMKNTSKGYSIYTTFQLQKNFMHGPLKGLYINGSFTFGKSKSVTDGSSSVASSAWKYRPAINPNAEEIGFSAASFDNRLLLQVAYTANWSKNAATNFGVVYQRYRPFRFSYTYNGDVNGDGQSMNDLIFIPAKMSDINIVPAAGDTRSKEQIWQQIDNFIEQDDYLSKHRGEYAERNGGVVPFANQVDVNISHDFKVPLRNGKVNTIRFSFDISNFLNLLNKDWGVQYTTIYGYAGSPQYQFLSMTEAPQASNNYTPGFTMPLKDGKPLTKTFKDLNGSDSRWAIMFGIKYTFN